MANETPFMGASVIKVLLVEDDEDDFIITQDLISELRHQRFTLDWAKTTWWMTPTASYDDFTAISQLPKVKLNITSRTERKGEDAITHVTIQNPSKNLAFFVRLKVDKGPRGEEILPVVWQDNYISLLPGEKRELTATYRAAELGAAKAAVEVSGWNVQP